MAKDYLLMTQTIKEYVTDPESLREVLTVLAAHTYTVYHDSHGPTPTDAAHDVSVGLTAVSNLTEWIESSRNIHRRCTT